MFSGTLLLKPATVIALPRQVSCFCIISGFSSKNRLARAGSPKSPVPFSRTLTDGPRTKVASKTY